MRRRKGVNERRLKIIKYNPTQNSNHKAAPFSVLVFGIVTHFLRQRPDVSYLAPSLMCYKGGQWFEGLFSGSDTLGLSRFHPRAVP